MRPVVHRVDLPALSGAVVLGMDDAIHDRITHQHIRMRHVDLGAQDLGPIGKFTALHALKKVAIFRRGAVAKGTVDASAGDGAAIAPGLFLGLVIDVGQAAFNQLQSPLKHLRKNVRGIARHAFPLPAQPLHVAGDAIDVFLILFRGIGVVIT